MQFGLVAANTWRSTTGAGAATLARAAEDAGFDSLWTTHRAPIHASRMGRGTAEERCHAWAERFGIR